jgi:hypothetical protein
MDIYVCVYTYTNAAAINRKKSNEFEGELKQVHSMDWRKEKERIHIVRERKLNL